MNKRTHIAAGLALLLTWGLQGCGGGAPKDDRPARTPVSGVVTYNGKPIEGATVTLIPTAVDGAGAAGLTNADGEFSLTTYVSDDGALPGSYVVTVTKFEAAAGGGNEVTDDDESYDGAPEETSSEPKNDLPAKYAADHTSGLKAEVGQEPITDLKFELKD